jgi:hypothetical protein
VVGGADSMGVCVPQAAEATLEPTGADRPDGAGRPARGGSG